MADIPAVGYLKLGEQPHLVAQSCNSCGALYFDRRNACARCAGDSFSERPLATAGVVRAYTVVHRAPRGTKTPFVSVVVDLDGGGTIKANLLDTTDPEEIQRSRRVELSTFAAGTDSDGVTAIGFGFVRAVTS